MAIAVDQALQGAEALALHVFGNLTIEVCRRRPRSRAILESEGLGKAGAGGKRHRCLEIPIGLARETDDNVGGQRDIGPGRAHSADHRLVFGGRVLPVHRLEDTVGTCLEGEVQIRHELRLVGEQPDQRSSMSSGWLVV